LSFFHNGKQIVYGGRYRPAAFKNQSKMNDALDIFLRLFPVTRVMAEDKELRYRFFNPATARYFEEKARDIIIENTLPLLFDLEEWRVGGRFREAVLVISVAKVEEEIPCL
jgi:hypothetical protein